MDDADDAYLFIHIKTVVGVVSHIRIAYIDGAETGQARFCQLSLRALAKLLDFTRQQYEVPL